MHNDDPIYLSTKYTIYTLECFLGLDDSSLDTSPLSSNGSRTPTRRSAADGVRKRLLLSTSYVSSDTEDSPCPKVNSHKT